MHTFATAPPTLLRSESIKSDQPRFIRVEFQFEFGKALTHCCKKAPCFSFVLEVQKSSAWCRQMFKSNGEITES